MSRKSLSVLVVVSIKVGIEFKLDAVIKHFDKYKIKKNYFCTSSTQ